MSVLCRFTDAVFLLFLICVFTLCLFFSASSRYELEFLPALMLLAVLGILGLEQALAGSPIWRRIARWCWCLLLAYTIGFNILASVETRATADCMVGNSLLHQGRVDEAVERFLNALALEPESASSHVGLGQTYCRIGRVDEAIIQFQNALDTDPNNAEAQYDLGCSLLQTGRGDEAIIHFQKALKIEPDFPETRDPAENNNMAWSFATCPEDSQRNGSLAVKLAESACRRTHYQQTIMVGTLAAAYAEAGRFAAAILIAQRACNLAAKNGETNLLQKNEELLALYQNHQSYRDRPANAHK